MFESCLRNYNILINITFIGIIFSKAYENFQEQKMFPLHFFVYCSMRYRSSYGPRKASGITRAISRPSLSSTTSSTPSSTFCPSTPLPTTKTTTSLRKNNKNQAETDCSLRLFAIKRNEERRNAGNAFTLHSRTSPTLCRNILARIASRSACETPSSG